METRRGIYKKSVCILTRSIAKGRNYRITTKMGKGGGTLGNSSRKSANPSRRQEYHRNSADSRTNPRFRVWKQNCKSLQVTETKQKKVHREGSEACWQGTYWSGISRVPPNRRSSGTSNVPAHPRSDPIASSSKSKLIRGIRCLAAS